jgi:hypothetical protein
MNKTNNSVGFVGNCYGNLYIFQGRISKLVISSRKPVLYSINFLHRIELLYINYYNSFSAKGNYVVTLFISQYFIFPVKHKQKIISFEYVENFEMF